MLCGSGILRPGRRCGFWDLTYPSLWVTRWPVPRDESQKKPCDWWKFTVHILILKFVFNNTLKADVLWVHYLRSQPQVCSGCLPFCRQLCQPAVSADQKACCTQQRNWLERATSFPTDFCDSSPGNRYAEQRYVRYNQVTRICGPLRGSGDTRSRRGRER